jgi:hypothetical protein
MWKERLWQMFLVAILGLTLTMCSRSSSNNSTSSTGILNADGTTTVNVGPSTISQTMLCISKSFSGGVLTYTSCDASDDTVLTDASITHDAAFAAGWKLVGSGCSSTNNGDKCFLFHK